MARQATGMLYSSWKLQRCSLKGNSKWKPLSRLARQIAPKTSAYSGILLLCHLRSFSMILCPNLINQPHDHRRVINEMTRKLESQYYRTFQSESPDTDHLTKLEGLSWTCTCRKSWPEMRGCDVRVNIQDAKIRASSESWHSRISIKTIMIKFRIRSVCCDTPICA